MYSNIFSCKNKTAIVAGGCGLIGREIVQGLSQHGARVYIADLDDIGAQKLIGDNIAFSPLDISQEDSVRTFVQRVLKESGRVDILVNCVYPRSQDWGAKYEDVGSDSWNLNVDHHLGGYFIMSKEVSLIMRNQGGGSIINVASIYGVVAPDFSIYEGTEMTMPVAYASIKAGIIALTRYIATYYGRYNVRANTVSPGGIFDSQDDAFVNKYARRTPLGRMGTPGEVVGAVIYLASDAASFVTGHNLIVDGGWTAW